MRLGARPGRVRLSGGAENWPQRHWEVAAGTVGVVQRVYFWFSNPALGGPVCGNHTR